MQDLKALEGKSLVELREIAKAIGIGDTTLKKRELIEKIAGFSASEGAPAENKEKRGRGRKKEVPATEMQQTAAIAEPAAVKAEAAPETVPQAPRGRRPRITNTKTENTAPAQRPPITVAGPLPSRSSRWKASRHLHQRQRQKPYRHPARRRPSPSAAAASPRHKHKHKHRKRQQNPPPQHPRLPKLPRLPRLPRQQPMRNPSTAR